MGLRGTFSLSNPTRPDLAPLEVSALVNSGGLGAGTDALRPGQKGSERQPGVGLAMGVPAAEPLARQIIWCSEPPPPGSERGAEGGQLPHLPPFVRDTPAGTGPGHPHHPGATRPHGCEHHHDLHPCAQPWSAWGTKPSRHSVTRRTVGSRTREPRLTWSSVLEDPLQDKELQGMAHWMPQWFSEGNGRKALVLGTVQ